MLRCPVIGRSESFLRNKGRRHAYGYFLFHVISSYGFTDAFMLEANSPRRLLAPRAAVMMTDQLCTPPGLHNCCPINKKCDYVLLSSLPPAESTATLSRAANAGSHLAILCFNLPKKKESPKGTPPFRLLSIKYYSYRLFVTNKNILQKEFFRKCFQEAL